MLVIKGDKCEKCPLLWEERFYDDYNTGCHANCEDGGFWCHMPKVIKTMKLKLVIKKQQKECEKYYDEL